MAKHIFVTGGVVSSLGKGLTSASIGLLLERHGLNVRMQKFDPYLNVDPGTMSPYQHGEVYVLDDGGETDLDLGHYERFTNAPLNKDCNYTTGRIYSTIIEKERNLFYKGKTVQVIPHVTDEIKDCIRKLATPNVDVVITEIGGTVGDIEAMPYFEAIRLFALEVGKQHCMFVHLTLVPYLKAADELKTKPTQHSVQELRKIGILPDVLICRSEKEIPRDDCDKIAIMCNVDRRAVIAEKDSEHSIYEVPLSLHQHGIDSLLIEKLGITNAHGIELDDWTEMVQGIRDRAKDDKGRVVTIAMVGKYVKHRDAYKSVYESLDHAGIHHGYKVVVERIESEDLTNENLVGLLSRVDGVLVPGGFDKRGVEGKIAAIRYAREQQVPFFGICLGLQCATIEYARNVLGLADADSMEFSKDTTHPVVCLMDDQKKVTRKGGTMRLGAVEMTLAPGTLVHKAYGADTVSERHRHRYEFNNDYRELFRQSGFAITGTTTDGTLVEVVELPGHPWFLAVQCHPEFKSKPTKCQPLFRDFVAAAIARKTKAK